MSENTNTELVEDRELEDVNGGVPSHFNWNPNSGLHRGHIQRERMSVNGLWHYLTEDPVDIAVT